MPILDRSSRIFPQLKKLFRKDLLILLGILAALLFFWGGIELINRLVVDRAIAFDEWILTSVRTGDELQYLKGPHWFTEAVRDVTAMGGPMVLTFMILSVIGYFLIMKNYRTALLVVVATAGGLLVSLLLKDFFLRERPDIVPALMVETSPSFPSGHSMLSAVIYLTLGSILTRMEPHPKIRTYTLALVILVVGLVGISRILLGVHYPTDVLVGWIVGYFWAALCWFVMMALQEQGAIEQVPDAEGDSPPAESGAV